MKELKSYQKEAIERYKDKNFMPLFFFPGLGKTATALRLVVEKGFTTDTIVLIIAPNKVHIQWQYEQIPEWLEDIPYEAHVFGGSSKKQDIKFYKNPSTNLHLLCVNIDTFSTRNKYKQVLAFIARYLHLVVILDEATSIKSIDSKRTKVIHKELPPAHLKIALTGTPITNNITDIWSIMEFLQPRYWGMNYHAFQQKYQIMCLYTFGVDSYGEPLTTRQPLTEKYWHLIHRCDTYKEAQDRFDITLDDFKLIKSQTRFMGNAKNFDTLKQKLDKDCFFLDINDSGITLPPKNYITRKVEMGREQKEAYRNMREQGIAEIETETEQLGYCTTKTKLSVCMRLQQISSGFLPVNLVQEDDDIQVTQELVWFKEVPKMDLIVADIVASAKPAIVITRFTLEAQELYLRCLEAKLSTMLLTGWQTTGTVQDVQEGKFEVVVANVKCIKEGFNLQNCSNMLYYSNTYSMHDRVQSEGRIYRMGQTKPCFYYDYINAGTIDEEVVNALTTQKDVLQALMSKL